MDIRKVIERNRFTALCGSCGRIFDYKNIDVLRSVHNGKGYANAETPCPACADGVLCACEYCQEQITAAFADGFGVVPYRCSNCAKKSTERMIGGLCLDCHHAFVKSEIAAAQALDAPTPSEPLRPDIEGGAA